MNETEFNLRRDLILSAHSRLKGNGTFRAARKASLDLRPPTRRASKAKGRWLKAERQQSFKWMFLTGGKNPPLRHKWGCP